jgi:peptide deformylase
VKTLPKYPLKLQFSLRSAGTYPGGIPVCYTVGHEEVGMIRPIIIAPDDRLTTVCEPVTAFDSNLHTLVEDLFATMYKSGGVGLAAPQVGVLQRVFVVDFHFGKKPHNPMSFVNPELLVMTGSAEDEEGCLSLPGLFLNVRRATYVYCSAYDLDGRKIWLQLLEMEARVWQHEMDHLEGILFTQRAGVELTAGKH